VKKETDPHMHSAEHILNQTMVRMFNCNRSFNAHIEKKKSKCDYHLDHALTEREINRIEKQVNAVIEADLPIAEEYQSREIAQEQYNLKQLPPDTGDNIRIVRIGDYDACPCIGSHVSSTKEIGTFRIVSTSFDSGVLRVRFRLGQSKAP
jgi:misacylated tRNA(Ala) deacylase